MIQMGFANRWVDTIMQCVTTVSYSMVMNGHRGEKFQPTRGLCQGDPLSPFLFLLCGKGLSSLLRLAEWDGLLRGVKVSKNGPPILHLLFTDDCILFKEAIRRGAHLFKNILEEYELCSGQCVNFDKSTVFFSKTLQKKKSKWLSIYWVFEVQTRQSAIWNCRIWWEGERRKLFRI